MTEFKSIDFVLPEAIKDFIFDLHQATRKSLRVDDINVLYHTKYRDLSEKYFAQSAWPTSLQVAPECYFDDDFLLLYKEMTYRHLFSKQRPTLYDHIDAWNNYVSLFEYLIKNKNPLMAISDSWAHEILNEFVYLFQDFCQFRAQVNQRTEDEISRLQQNKTVWALPEVIRLLKSLIEVSEQSSAAIHKQMGYFSVIELARLECLIGDYTTSLAIFSHKRLRDSNELFSTIPLCHANVNYHTGISFLMSSNYTAVIDVLSEIILYVTRQLSPGGISLRPATQSAVQKLLDKIIAITGIAVALAPEHRLDIQVTEILENKLGDRLRRMQSGDLNTFEDVFDMNCPKFISPAFPDFTANLNPCQEMIRHQVSVLSNQISRQVSLVKLRSILKLYSSIPIKKLATLNDSSEEGLRSGIIAYKKNLLSSKLSSLSAVDSNIEIQDVIQSVGTNSSDIHFFIDGDDLIIDFTASGGGGGKSRGIERYLLSGVRKHAEICGDLKTSFEKYGL